MAKRSAKKRVEIFYYQCSITGERFKVNKEAPSPDELISVNAYYELNPELDDRPEKIKKIVQFQEPSIFDEEEEAIEEETSSEE